MDEVAKAKAKERIGKFLNMTVANGCSEDEQESAMRLAAAAATRAGIDLDAFQAEQAKASDVAAPLRKATSKHLREEWKIHQVLAAQAAAVLYGVEVYTYSGGKGGLFFVGREENIELTEQTMFWLMRQVELLYKQNLTPGLSQKVRAEFRKTFKAACALRVYHRALDLMRDMKTNQAAAQSATGQNALVVQGYFETLKQENLAYFGADEASVARHREKEEARRNALTPQQRDLEDRQKAAAAAKAAKRKGPRPRYIPVGNGTNSGTRAGDSVKLRKEIG
jgi:hypothetical protein